MTLARRSTHVSLCALLASLAGCPGGGSGTATTGSTTTVDATAGTSTTGADTGEAVTTSGTSTTSTTSSGPDTDGTAGATTLETTTTGGSTTDEHVDFGCDDTTGGDTTGDTDGEGVCACIVDDPEGGPLSQPICGEELCPVVNAEPPGCDTGCEPFEFTVTNPEALECALKALRDRTPGIVRWSWSENGGQFSDSGYVLIRGDGVAIRRGWGAHDICYVVGEARSGLMPDACAFAQCLAVASDELRFDCLRKFPLAPPSGSCDDGWEDCDT